MSQGSVWNIWDLHLHTPFSYLNNQYGDPDNPDTWQNYVSNIETIASQKNIVALGITDYFSIEGYKKLLDLQKINRLKNILLIPNIEFRIDKLIYRTKANTEPKRINLHVLFSPTISPREIEEGFLHDLDFVFENEPFDAPKTRKLNLYNLEIFGETLKSQHKKFQDLSSIQVGCMTAVVQAEQIKRRLEDRFRGNYLLVLANENLELMSWDGQDHAIRKQLIQMSHAIFSSFESDRRFCLGQTHETITEYLKEFKSLKPCVWGCDSHGYNERFLEPDLDRYCWIKADVTWEGLKQVIFEPYERVRVQAENPEPNKSIYSLSNINFPESEINTSLKFDSFFTDLNLNLITIIGGRGSGKTAFLDLVAACFNEGKKLQDIEESFFHRLYVNDTMRRKKSNQPLSISIEFKSGEKFSKNIGLDTKHYENANILYLTQNHFDEFTENSSKLNNYIIDLVFNKYLDDRLYFDEIDTDINSKGRDIENVNLEIQQLRDEIEGKKVLEETEQNKLAGEMTDISHRITEAESKENTNVQKLHEFSNLLSILRNKKRTVRSVTDEIENLTTNISKFCEDYKSKSSQINSTLSTIDSNLAIIPIEVKELVNVQNNITTITNDLYQLLTDIENQLETNELRINDLQGIDRQIAEWRQRLMDINTRIDITRQNIIEIDNKEKKIITLEEKRELIYFEMIQKQNEQKEFLQRMIDKFEVGQDEMLNRLKFTAILDQSQCNQLITNIINKVNKQAINENELVSSIRSIYTQIHNLLCDESNNESSIQIKSCIHQLIQLINSLKKKQAISESDLFDTVLTPFCIVGLRIQFNDRELDSLSMGERAIVLLKILLALDDKPLLLDQPEEHLDNRYIYDELAPAFKRAKKSRQIIMATHNANLVVNTDAEQIILAENNNGKISYKVGTLESMDLRESIKQILEGGEEAFLKREEKYGIRV